jgi:hypothetical protein
VLDAGLHCGDRQPAGLVVVAGQGVDPGEHGLGDGMVGLMPGLLCEVPALRRVRHGGPDATGPGLGRGIGCEKVDQDRNLAQCACARNSLAEQPQARSVVSDERRARCRRSQLRWPTAALGGGHGTRDQWHRLLRVVLEDAGESLHHARSDALRRGRVERECVQAFGHVHKPVAVVAVPCRQARLTELGDRPLWRDRCDLLGSAYEDVVGTTHRPPGALTETP